MKLRIRGATLRLRLTRGEVDQLAAGEAITERTPFPDGSVLEYALLPAEQVSARQVAMSVDTPNGPRSGTRIEIEVPATEASTWGGSDEVGFSGEDSIQIGELEVLIEKDFTCITPREGEEELDTYPNPNAAQA